MQWKAVTPISMLLAPISLKNRGNPRGEGCDSTTQPTAPFTGS
jgi:hypothetical protein